MTFLTRGMPAVALRGPTIALLSLALVALLPTDLSRKAEAAEMLPPGERIQVLAKEAIAVMVDEALEPKDRRAAFRELLNDAFDLDNVAKFVLGRHGRRLNAGQRAEFRQLFEDFLIVSYVSKLDTYAGEDLVVHATRETGPKRVTVTSDLRLPSGEPVGVDWHMREGESNWQIVDIVIEGVSLAVTIRSEFTSVISKSGGVAELLKRLRRVTSRAI